MHLCNFEENTDFPKYVVCDLDTQYLSFTFSTPKAISCLTS